jgi:hypothetical protein
MDDDHIVVWQTFSGAFTLDEYRAVEVDTYALIEEVAHTVDVVCDLSAARHLPSNLASLTHRPARHLPPNMGITIIVGAPPYIRKLAEFAGKMKIEREGAGTDNTVFVATMAEAHAHLERLRAQRSPQPDQGS